MDQHEDSTTQTPNIDQRQYKFIKKTLQFLVPFSLFSFSFFHFMIPSFYFSHTNFRFPTFVFPLLAHALDRKFMFLVCNAILAFLAKTSSIFNRVPELPEVKAVSLEDNEVSVESAKEQKQEEMGSVSIEIEGRKNGDWIGESEARDDDEVAAGTTLDDEVEESITQDGDLQVEEGKYVNVNTDELNKKIEEFIRKMKEEIRIEAQQQLVQQLVECN